MTDLKAIASEINENAFTGYETGIHAALTKYELSNDDLPDLIKILEEEIEGGFTFNVSAYLAGLFSKDEEAVSQTWN